MEDTISNRLRLSGQHKLADKFDAALAAFTTTGDRAAFSALLDVWLEVKLGKLEQTVWYPDDDPRWQEYTPGAPMPCKPDTRVLVLFRGEREMRRWYTPPMSAGKWDWNHIVAWRPV